MSVISSKSSSRVKSWSGSVSIRPTSNGSTDDFHTTACKHPLDITVARRNTAGRGMEATSKVIHGQRTWIYVLLMCAVPETRVAVLPVRMLLPWTYRIQGSSQITMPLARRLLLFSGNLILGLPFSCRQFAVSESNIPRCQCNKMNSLLWFSCAGQKSSSDRKAQLKIHILVHSGSTRPE